MSQASHLNLYKPLPESVKQAHVRSNHSFRAINQISSQKNSKPKIGLSKLRNDNKRNSVSTN